MNLLEIGKILRPHGIKGGVKVESFLDEGLNTFKKVIIKNEQCNVSSIQTLNNDAFVLYLDNILSVEEAEKYRGASIFIDRDIYPNYCEKLYLSDLLNKPVLDENGNKIGDMVDFDEYGASVVLTIRVGAVSYQLPYVQDIINFDKDKSAFIVEKTKFENMRV